MIARFFLPLPAALVIALASLATLGFALAMQFVFNHPPCELCLWQRVPYLLAVLLAAASAILSSLANGGKSDEASRKRKNRQALTLLKLCALVFLASAALGLYHSGVERHWWQSATSCALPPLRGNPANLRAQLLAMPAVRCDEIGWSVLGMTMANINIPFSLALAAFAALAGRAATSSRNKGKRRK